MYSRILLSLPDDKYDALLPHLEFVELRLHQSLHESPDGLEYGYFLNFGLTSLVIAIKDGRRVEVGLLAGKGLWVHPSPQAWTARLTALVFTALASRSSRWSRVCAEG